MSHYLVLEKMQVQNANCISGLTYGFPSITHFMGYSHAMSRQLSKQFGLQITGCAVICHQHQIHSYQPSGWGDHVFALARAPLNEKGRGAPIAEEGRMHLTVTLVMQCSAAVLPEQHAALIERVTQLTLRQKLAGGVVVDVKGITLYSSDDNTSLSRKILRRAIPGFVLADRSSLLKQHHQALQAESPSATMLDAWLDFSALTYQAVPAEPTQGADPLTSVDCAPVKADWIHVPKPAAGYLVPLAVGYKAISHLYAPGEVANSRDLETPCCFVEAAYGIGQWLSPHRIDDLQNVLWRYAQHGSWYVCQTQQEHDTLAITPEQASVIADDNEIELTYF